MENNHYSFFNSDISHRQKLVDQLILHIAYRELDQAEKMIQLDPSLLLEEGTVTDYSNRTFKKITAFQYMIWARDRDGWEMLLKYLSLEEAARQLKAHEAKTDHPHGVYYSFGKLKLALSHLQEKLFVWRIDHEERGKTWREKVGDAQKEVPVWLAGAYCYDQQGFYPAPEKIEKLPNNLSFAFYDSVHSDTYVPWYPLNKSKTGLAIDFAIWREGCPFAVASVSPRSPISCVDYEAILAIEEIRLAEFAKLKNKLCSECEATRDMTRTSWCTIT